MKKGIRLLLIAGMCLFLSSCKNDKIVGDHISANDSENEGDYILQSIQIDHEYVDNILCIQNENIIYSSYENQDTILAFYRYDFNENLTYRIGEIKDPYINSGDVTAMDNKIFFYCNMIVQDADHPEAKLESSLYQIDISENTLQKIASDHVDQTLVYLDSSGNSIISFKGRLNGNYGITYLDKVDFLKENPHDFDVFIYKEYDRQEKTGEVIYNFSEYNSSIYILVGTRKSADDISWAIEKYDCDGNYIDEVSLDDKTAEMINGERISKFEIYGKCGFIRTFSGSGILLDISTNEVVPTLLSETDLDIAVPADNSVNAYAVLYSRDTGEIWRLDIANYTLYKLDLPFKYINYVYVSNDNHVLISSDDTIYGKLVQIPWEEENILEH